MSILLVSQRRIFTAKPSWSISAPVFIGEIESLVNEVLTNQSFKNGVEYIKELEGTKFVRVSKKDIKALLSNTPEQIELFNQLSKIY